MLRAVQGLENVVNQAGAGTEHHLEVSSECAG